MSLNPADIATVSRLLDEALALPAEQRDAWLAALPDEHQRHADTLRQMLAREAELDTDSLLDSLPRMAPDESVARPGDLIGPYRLRHEIGRGGMGSVWLAERADGTYKRQVALKLPRLAWGSGLAERMARERDIGALLEHPNIARLYDAGVDARGRPYLALEYIDGQAIDVWCEAKNLSVRDRLCLFVPVARAVAYAHGRLVVHRDLKPSNVLVTPDGQVHLLDFGIAKLLQEANPDEPGLTQQQGRVMTPHYASPEQVAGEAITVQSDVYSLGVLLYELLTGLLPIAPKRSTLGAVEEAILQGDVPLASSRVKDRSTARALRGEVDAILGKAMQREPAGRYATADAMALDVERHLAGETVAARPDSFGYRLHKLVRRHWVGFSASISVVLAIVVGSMAIAIQSQRVSRSAERERAVRQFVTDVFRINSRGNPGSPARPLSTEAMVESGARLIETRFKDQADIQSELNGVVSEVFFDMGANSLAADYAGRQLASMKAVGFDATQQAPAALRLARALLGDGRLAQAEKVVRELLGQLGEGDAVELEALVLLARVRYEARDVDQTRRLLEQIDRRFQALGNPATTDRAWAAALRAELLALDDVQKSVSAFARAIAIAEQAEGGQSLTAVVMRLSLASSMGGSAANPNEAQVWFDQALRTLDSLGGIYRNRAAFERAQHAWTRAIAGKGSTPAAHKTIAESRQQILDSPIAVPSWYVPQLDYWTASLKARLCDYSQLSVLEASVARLKEALQSPAAQIQMAWTMAIALMTVGRHDEADGWFRRNIELRRQTDADTSLMVWAHGYAAMNRMMEERYDDALSLVEAGARMSPSSTRDPRFVLYTTEELVTAKAETLLMAGDPASAIELLRPIVARARSTVDIWDQDMATWTGKVYGEALCRLGRPRDGLAYVRAFINFQLQNKPSPVDPYTARARAVAGVCALSAGDRSDAVRLAAEARAAFTAQPGVSPYFRAPLNQLERALRLRLAAL